ncbi:MAG TPA: hypothetical protein VEL75_14760 [Candidatus Methylomirabilis sp.]|nr:hypothetical protein [Candidatus Methylomirabilis sp.]
MQRYLVPILATILGAGLAGCAEESAFNVRFFKPYGPGQVEQRHLGVNLVTVSQTDEILPSGRPGAGPR